MNLKNTLINDLVDEHKELFLDRCNLGMQQCRDELDQVLEYLDGRKFNHFVEVGSDEAGSLWFYGNTIVKDRGKITATDIKIKDVVIDAVSLLKDKGYDATYIESPSGELEVSDFDLIHIDGDHQYNAVRGDFNKFYPLLNNGGVMLIHDTLLWDGCIRLREEIEKEYDCVTFAGHDLITGHWGVNKEGPLSTGITLLQK